MNSMTGYGKAVAEKDGRKITVEMKSVNHRFLDVTIKLPKILNCLEDGIRKILQENFARGHFDVYVTYENLRIDNVSLTLNEGVANEYLKIKKMLVESYGVTDDYTVTAMMKTPELIVEAKTEEDEEAIKTLTIEATQNACEQMKTMRAFEGEKLFVDINKKVDFIENTVKEVKTLAPKVIESYRSKLKDRITEALSGVAVDEARLLNEVAFYSDKVAIDEEITRLFSHCQHIREMLNAKTPMGKNMDFLVQEFNRESNTIGSKCNDIQITNLVLNLKNEIEKIREQVQNVE